MDQAIESILTQEDISFELLLVVNGGDEELRARLTRVYGQDPRVVIVYTEMAGLAFALNIGVAIARGKYVARADADDVSHASRLRRQVDFLEANTDVAVVGCRVRLIGADGKPLQRKIAFFGSDQDIRRVLPYRNPLVHPALTFRRDVLLEMRGYCYGHMSEDHELFLRIARTRWRFANLGDTLFDYRRHPEQITNAAHAWKHFAEISGFLLTEFLRSGSPKYLLGIAVVFPPLRWGRNLGRRLRLGRNYDGGGGD